MTAEILIMNKEAVALAADSAVTVDFPFSAPKIYYTANKIFQLSYKFPVGIMIYGNTNFMSVPWSTIIKLFRKEIDSEKESIKDYVVLFIDFLKSKSYFFKEHESKWIEQFVNGYFLILSKIIAQDIDKLLKNKGMLTNKEVVSIIEKKLQEIVESWKRIKDNITGTIKSWEKVKKRFETLFKELSFKFFPTISENVRRKLLESIKYIFIKKHPFLKPPHSGVIVAGFGSEEIFPAFSEIEFYGIFENDIVYDIIKEDKVTYESNSLLVPFAQKNEIITFLDGIQPKYLEIILGIINNIISNICQINNIEIIKIIRKQILDIRKNFHKPILTIISYLPKDELGNMAETLINLTSFKRHVSISEETVGGPVDVAVISKGDGFVWLKRKHYFDPKLNPQYFMRFNLGIKGD